MLFIFQVPGLSVHIELVHRLDYLAARCPFSIAVKLFGRTVLEMHTQISRRVMYLARPIVIFGKGT